MKKTLYILPSFRCLSRLPSLWHGIGGISPKPKPHSGLLLFIFLLFFNLIIFNLNIFNLYCQQPTQEWVRRFSDTTIANWGASSIKSDSLGFIYVHAETSQDFGFIKYDSNGNLLVVASHWPGGFETGGGRYFDVAPSGDVYITGGVSISVNTWMYTVKYNSNGVFQWGRYYNSDNGDVCNDIKVDKTGNIVVVGIARVNNTRFALTIKYNPLGDTLWTRRFNNGQDAYNNKVTFDNLNNLYITGYIGSPSKCLTMGYNSSGNLEWVRTFTNDSLYSHMGQNIIIDEFGNLYIVATGSVPFAGLNDYLIKMTIEGTILWSRVFKGIVGVQGQNSGTPMGPVISSDAHSIYFSTMSTNGTGGGGHSIATVKYNSSGDSQWVKVYNGGGVPGTANRVTGIKLDRNDNVYVFGSGYFQTTGDDLVAVKYSSAGVQQWVITYSGIITNGGDGASDLFIDTSLNLYIAGNSKKATNNGNVAVTMKYSQPIGIITNNNQYPREYRLKQNYPNPFNPSTKIKFSVAKKSTIQLKIFDVLGRTKDILVNEKLFPSEYELTFDASNYSSGVYFYQLITDGSIIDTKKMIVLK